MTLRGLVGEVEHVNVVLEGQVLRVAVAGEEIENPLLLFGREQAVAAVVAVVGAVAAQIGFQLFVQGCVVFLLHFVEEWRQAVGGMNDAYLLEMAAVAIAVGCGIDGRTPCLAVGYVQSCLKAQAVVVLGTAFAETVAP